MLRGAGISTHVPRTGHDNMEDATWFHTHIFQSTRPLRGTTNIGKYANSASEISIHAPLTGHDACVFPFATSTPAFQSTCPVRGTTSARSRTDRFPRNFNPRAPYGARRGGPHRPAPWRLGISIHVPRTGHDGCPWHRQLASVHISIHVPRTGHDADGDATRAMLTQFQSTCPVRGTTRCTQRSFPT